MFRFVDGVLPQRAPLVGLLGLRGVLVAPVRVGVLPQRALHRRAVGSPRRQSARRAAVRATEGVALLTRVSLH